MRVRTHLHALPVTLALTVLVVLFVLPGCSTKAPPAQTAPIAASPAATPTTTPDWFNIQLTDARTGQSFSMNDFSGKVVLLETMAQWCPTCVQQQNEVKKLQALTHNSPDLIHISLDTDLHEDAASLAEYANSLGFDWYFAVSPLEVDRALGNLYSAEFMNPPFAPMLIIDRQGAVTVLPLGIKKAEALQQAVAPHLAP